MKYIQGTNRNQTYLFPTTLEEAIGQDNEVRLIDIFVDSLELREFGFKVTFEENGRLCHDEALAKFGQPIIRPYC